MNTTQNILAGVNTNMGNALHAAALLAVEKASAPANNDVPGPLVIPRLSLLNEPILFFAETQDRENNTVEFWDGKKGSKKIVAPFDFYKNTRSLDDEVIRNKLLQDYSREFNVKQMTVRARMIKHGASLKQEAGKAAQIDVEAFKKRLLAALIPAIEKAILEA